jgi:hypothetical protein
MTSDSESDDGEEIRKPGNGAQKQREEGERAEILPPSLVSALEGAGVDPRDPSVTKALAISLTKYNDCKRVASAPSAIGHNGL